MAINTAVLNSKPTIQQSFVQRYTLPIFFALVFSLTWPFLIVDALGSHDILPFRLPLPLMLVMGYMPTLAAIIVTMLVEDKGAIRPFLRKFLIWRVGLKWYLVAIGGFGLICFGAVLLANLLGANPSLPLVSEEVAGSGGLGLVFSFLILFTITTLINGEEFAWRGFALPRLQTRWNAFASSLILGLVWTLFHLPLFFTLTGSSQAGPSFTPFLVQTIGMSVLFTWLFNNTGGSVLLAYLLHGAANTWTRIFPIEHGGSLVDWSMAGIICLMAILVILIFGPTQLNRQNQVQRGR